MRCGPADISIFPPHTFLSRASRASTQSKELSAMLPFSALPYRVLCNTRLTSDNLAQIIRHHTFLSVLREIVLALLLVNILQYGTTQPAPAEYPQAIYGTEVFELNQNLQQLVSPRRYHILHVSNTTRPSPSPHQPNSMILLPPRRIALCESLIISCSPTMTNQAQIPVSCRTQRTLCSCLRRRHLRRILFRVNPSQRFRSLHDAPD